MQATKQFLSIRYEEKDGILQQETITDTILTEYTFSVSLNGEFYQDFHCFPDCLDALVIGNLYTSGRISKREDVLSYSIDKEAGIGNFTIIENKREMKPVGEISILPQEILPMSSKLLTSSKTFQKTGNVHSVMLCEGTNVLAFGEDVDRYNAFDKTIGKAVMKSVDFSKTSIYTTGRIPSQIAKRAIFSGIPMLISRSAPTDLSIALADEYHLTIVGFARGNRMNVYHPL